MKKESYSGRIPISPKSRLQLADPARKRSPQHHRHAIQHLSERDQDLFELFGYGVSSPLPYKAIHYAFEEMAQQFPNAIAAIHGEETITYKDLNIQANLLAEHLRLQGIGEGDKVAVFIERSIPMLAGILGILKIGAAYIPQDIRIVTEKLLTDILHSSEASCILSISKHQDKIPMKDTIPYFLVDTFMQQAARREDYLEYHFQTKNEEFDASNNCFILFTSGTTGVPNGVQISHENVCNIIHTSPGNLGIVPGDKVAHILSISFDMAAWEIFACLSYGGTLLIRGKSIPETAQQANIIISTPSVLATVDPHLCHEIKTVAVAGEPCPLPLANAWAAKGNFFNNCGPTETTIVNTMEKCKPGASTINIGKPTPNNTVYVLDKHMKALPIGEVGIMWGGGKCVSGGYINNPELTKKRYAYDPFLDDGSMMFNTGDLGRWTEDGKLEHHGRIDDQVKIKGFRVELDSVSRALESHPLCQQAVTVKIDDRTLVSYVVAKVQNTEVLRKIVASKLPYYYVPEEVLVLEELPKTKRGKIDKRLLIRQYQEERDNKQAQVEVPTPPIDLDDVDLPDQLPFFSRIFKGERLMHYNRLIFLTLIVNIFLLRYGWEQAWFEASAFNLHAISRVVLFNLAAAVFIRQQYVINLLFKFATSFSLKWPLAIRRRMGKIYHFGGIHVGGSLSAALWYAVFLVGVINNYIQQSLSFSSSFLLLNAIILLLIVGMILTALPSLRAKFHDRFEFTHRFGGWSLLALFWVQTMLSLKTANLGQLDAGVIFGSLDFWVIFLMTVSIALPWTRLRKIKVDIETPSNHVAIASFDYGVTPFAGSSTSLSRHPLKDWHSFANIPAPGEEGFRLTISRAGDWTAQLIEDKPDHIWVKGIPTAGVGNIDQLFKKVVWVATGSGIGPCLPHLIAQTAPAKLIWATRNPRKTYGDQLVDEILEAQPDALIWDTDAFGKPDMLKLAYQAYQQSGAEAVICISNKKLTWLIVEGLESRNIPAYGAIWDS